jgi:hypothetical protein
MNQCWAILKFLKDLWGSSGCKKSLQNLLQLFVFKKLFLRDWGKFSKFWGKYFHPSFRVSSLTHFRLACIWRQFSHISFQILSYLRLVSFFLMWKNTQKNEKMKKNLPTFCMSTISSFSNEPSNVSNLKKLQTLSHLQK